MDNSRQFHASPIPPVLGGVPPEETASRYTGGKNAYRPGVEDLPQVLVVDDSKTVRRSIVNALHGRYQCFESESTLDAIDQLRKGQFSIVIADVIIPGLSGIELLRKVVSDFPGVSVIMVSSVDKPQRALDAVRLGAFDYLIKPFDPYVLEMTVDRAFERQRLLNNAKQYKADLEARNAELVARKAELESLQVKMVQSEKMASLGRLAAGVAHELNNPVGFIYSNLDLLSKDVSALTALIEYYESSRLPDDIREGGEKIREALNVAFSINESAEMIRDCMEGAERIRSIVQNLRTFSRLDEAEVKLADLHEGIDSSIRLLSTFLSSGKVNLVREYGEDVPKVDCYAGQLNQVWMNILANAAQALPSMGGTISVATRRIEDQVQVEISDTGRGISAAELDRIFDPFFTTKPLGEGTGLGLSISFGIIEKHKGSISVASEPGVGTSFTVSLPIRMVGESVHD